MLTTDQLAVLGADAVAQHDVNATKLTEARKLLREIQDLASEWRGGKAPQAMAQLTDAIDLLNSCIIASRKLVKGEKP